MDIVHKAMKNTQAVSKMLEETYSIFLAAGFSQDHPQEMKLAKPIAIVSMRTSRSADYELLSRCGFIFFYKVSLLRIFISVIVY